MKMFYGNIPVNSMKIKHYEVSTNDSNLKPSDMQDGIVAYRRRKRIIGTWRCFEFAQYENMKTNSQSYIPSLINVIEITSLDYPMKSSIALNSMVDIDFSIEQTIGVVVIDNIEYPITVKIEGDSLTLNCEKTISLQFFYGRDNYAW